MSAWSVTGVHSHPDVDGGLRLDHAAAVPPSLPARREQTGPTGLGAGPRLLEPGTAWGDGEEKRFPRGPAGRRPPGTVQRL